MKYVVSLFICATLNSTFNLGWPENTTGTHTHKKHHYYNKMEEKN